jgi:transposase-like protein
VSRRWKGEFEGHAAEAFLGKGMRTVAYQHIDEPESKNPRLRKERNILKKATTFFSKARA